MFRVVAIERGFLSQKRSGVGRGVKEKNVNGNKTNTFSGIGVSIKSDNTINEDTPVGVTSAVQECVTPSVEKEKQSSLEDTTGLGSFPPLPTHECVTPSVEKEKQSSLEDTTGLGSFPPLPTHVITSAGNAPGKSSYANAAGKPNGKKLNIRTLFTPGVTYPIVANYVRNTLVKSSLVCSMFSVSINLFSFQFSSMDGLHAKLKNGPWFIQNNPLILMKCHPDENLLKEDVSTILVWVKLYGIPVTAFSDNSLSVSEKKTLKKPSQPSRGISVGSKIGFHTQKDYKLIKKLTASSSGNKKKGGEPTIAVSNSNPFKVLNLVDNDVEIDTNAT
uniref:Uncharacterized protein n=1 Tax=Tanacetum cinerariifolium TaxID=118510 RepID=A0A699KWL8_TANCI|nr:hypothetical protein [Tanacetum cinerariifolium]